MYFKNLQTFILQITDVKFIQRWKVRKLNKLWFVKGTFIKYCKQSFWHSILVWVFIFNVFCYKNRNKIGNTALWATFSSSQFINSFKTILLQLVEGGHIFRKYDYGAEENQKHYNNSIPPDFNISNITTPIYIFYGDGDRLIAKNDVIELAKAMPSIVKLHKVDFPNWWVRYPFFPPQICKMLKLILLFFLGTTMISCMPLKQESLFMIKLLIRWKILYLDIKNWEITQLLLIEWHIFCV